MIPSNSVGCLKHYKAEHGSVPSILGEGAGWEQRKQRRSTVLTFKAGLPGLQIIPWPGKFSGSDQSKDQLLLCRLTGEGEVGGGATTGKGEHIPP